MPTTIWRSLSLRARITLIAIGSMLLVGITLAIADRSTFEQAENQIQRTLLRGKQVLWEKIVATRLKELNLALPTFTRDRIALRALSSGDYATLNARMQHGFDVLEHGYNLRLLRIVDTAGTIVFDSAGGKARANTMKVVSRALKSVTNESGLERLSDGTIAALLAFPLHSNGDLVGVGLLAIGLKPITEEFGEADQVQVFVTDSERNLVHASNAVLFNKMGLELPADFAPRVFNQTLGDVVYTVSLLPLLNGRQQAIGYLITAADSTENYYDTRRRRLGAYTATILGILVAAVWVWFYMRNRLLPLGILTREVNRIGAGDTSARSSITGGDEFGQLGKAFNGMAQTVEDSIRRERQRKEDLEEKVKIILATVKRIEDGDLGAQFAAFDGNDAIDQLANGVRGMLQKLCELVAQVQKAGTQVTLATTDIAATANQHESTVAEQATSINQIMATATEISATSRELAKNMHEITAVAEATTDSASDGQNALSSMEATMHGMSKATNAITSKLAVLSEKAANINNVVTTITKVADQTNLLSLNAAIEAEKAGEYGLGFSVVATEIRRLADQTAVATWDIEQMVKEMQSAVSAGVMGMDKFSEEVNRGVSEVAQVGSQLAEIIEQVQALTPRFEAANQGMQSQAEGAEQISISMVQLNNAARQTMETLQDTNRSIESLKDASTQLQDRVSQFRTES